MSKIACDLLCSELYKAFCRFRSTERYVSYAAASKRRSFIDCPKYVTDTASRASQSMGENMRIPAAERRVVDEPHPPSVPGLKASIKRCKKISMVAWRPDITGGNSTGDRCLFREGWLPCGQLISLNDIGRILARAVTLGEHHSGGAVVAVVGLEVVPRERPTAHCDAVRLRVAWQINTFG